MSTISGSPEFKKMQEQYLQRERENDEKNELKVKELTNKSHEDLKSLDEHYSAQIDDLKNRNREMLTAQEKKHVKEMEDMRAFYIKKLENATKE